ncbi:hypothetical protein HH310_08745 [Actinoplanes sp. TBRC 11911]|uniref:hypothetical protein n=1 Tax=Actinoplanes sp. TBRC 11911 TaxID=2729386 RepID=UPI00145C9FAC|nr:hypothetical protein [Actinoplanes sp. TBRC 11911]NMO51274.1 hypothetical protein [Actinoplanes sp. TBRC 11911]
MAELARVLPRYWDGRRLLRFLAGLAMVALALTAPAFSEPVSAGPAVPVSIARPAAAAAPVVDAASSHSAVPVASMVDRSFGELPLPALPSTLVVAVAVGILAGVASRVRAPRAPPAI